MENESLVTPDSSFNMTPAPNVTETDVAVQNVAKIVVPIVNASIVVIGLFGNILVVLVVSLNQQMRNTTNLLIINLAVADLMFITFCVPFTSMDYTLEGWPFGNIWCKSVQYLIYLTAYASVYTLVLMSIDRFLAVVHPISSLGFRNERNCTIAIVTMWTILIASCSPIFLAHKEVPSENPSQSSCMFDGDNFDLVAFRLGFFITSYLIPLSLICVLYMFVLRRLWFGSAPGGHCSAESMRGKKRVTMMVVIVVVVFAICWLPINIILTLSSMGKYGATLMEVLFLIGGQALAYMNSCVNPILYAFLSENFRKGFRKVIFCNAQSRLINGRVDLDRYNTTRLTSTSALRNARNQNDNVEVEGTSMV